MKSQRSWEGISNYYGKLLPQVDLEYFDSILMKRPRMNFSVFECMLTDVQYRNMCKRLEKLIVKREDWVNIYPLCTECYARITYIPDIKKKEPVKIVVI